MSLGSPRVWIGAVSAGAVLLVAVVAMERTSPGPLALVHGRESELASPGSCSQCHGGWFSSMRSACLECHAPIAAQIDGEHGLHGAIAGDLIGDCGLCHGEHNGPGFPLVNRQSFVLAGASGIEDFDHRLVGFAMDGAHLEQDCADCHEQARAPVLPKGGARFLGLDQDCATCHEDAHEGRYRPACASCHGQSKWDELHSVGHERYLPLAGGHARVACLDCHEEGGRHSLELLGGAPKPPVVRDCLDCHESPHAEPFLEGTAALAGAAPGAACAACHAADHESFRDERLTLLPEQHAAAGFALDAPHDQAGCEDCHPSVFASFAARYPGRGADECSACHDDPHGGQFTSGPFSGGDCVACHERTRFEPHAFTAEMHEQAALALDGAHLEVECETCHEIPWKNEPRVFRGTPSRCEGCHEDAHRGYFAPFAPELAEVEAGQCAACHNTTRFAEVAPGRFDHGAWTGFAVAGAHEQAGCEACHAPAEEPDDRGRSFGWIAERFGRYEGCATCHEDPHEGRFDGPELAPVVEGRADCARCHVETSFRSFEAEFDHRRWTGFDLSGPHGEAACSACHPPLSAPEPGGRTWEHAQGPLCADCHEDPHAGQFTTDAGTDCQRCHASDRPYYLRFNHERDSRFPLGEAHRKLECAACHFPTEEQGIRFVRYRPLGIECVDCHGVHEEVLLRQKPKRN
jgi:hypothetical protein